MATINSVAGADTPNTGRAIWNANDTAINNEVIEATADIAAHVAAGSTDHDGRYSQITDLNTHKTSSDHDGRYYSETEIDAMAVKLTGAQTVAGVKTLTDDLVVKKASPAVELQDASANKLAKLTGSTDSDNSLLLQVYDTSQAQFVTVLKIQKNGDLTNLAGEKLASTKYVQDRIRSGFFHKDLSIGVASLADGTTYYVEDARGGALLIPIPNGAILKNVTYNYRTATAIADDQNRIAVPITFTDGGYRWLYIRAVFTNSTNSLVVSIGAGKWVPSVESITWTVVDTISDGDFVTGNPVTLYVGLEFSL
jgi:hypothetical protein